MYLICLGNLISNTDYFSMGIVLINLIVNCLLLKLKIKNWLESIGDKPWQHYVFFDICSFFEFSFKTENLKPD